MGSGPVSAWDGGSTPHRCGRPGPTAPRQLHADHAAGTRPSQCPGSHSSRARTPRPGTGCGERWLPARGTELRGVGRLASPLGARLRCGVPWASARAVCVCPFTCPAAPSPQLEGTQAGCQTGGGWGPTPHSPAQAPPPAGPHLAVDEDHGAQESPGAALAVHVQHAQDLEEADAPAGGEACVPTGRIPAPQPSGRAALVPSAPPPERLHALPVPGHHQPSSQTSRLRFPGGQVAACVRAARENSHRRTPPGRPPRGPPTAGGPPGAYLMAEVANTCPLEPTQSTTMEATTTMRSEGSRALSPAWPLAQGTELGGGTASRRDPGGSDGRPGPVSRTCRAARPPPAGAGGSRHPHCGAQDAATPAL